MFDEKSIFYYIIKPSRAGGEQSEPSLESFIIFKIFKISKNLYNLPLLLYKIKIAKTLEEKIENIENIVIIKMIGRMSNQLLAGLYCESPMGQPINSLKKTLLFHPMFYFIIAL